MAGDSQDETSVDLIGKGRTAVRHMSYAVVMFVVDPAVSEWAPSWHRHLLEEMLWSGLDGCRCRSVRAEEGGEDTVETGWIMLKHCSSLTCSNPV